jgi:hypothetical protein
LSIDAVEKMLSGGLALHCRHNITLNRGLALALRIGIAMDKWSHISPGIAMAMATIMKIMGIQPGFFQWRTTNLKSQSSS